MDAGTEITSSEYGCRAFDLTETRSPSKASKPRRLSQKEMEEVGKEIEDLLRQGLIETSNSPWAAPIVCARRKNGQLRLAIDYRALNTQSLPTTLHPIPHMDDLLDRLGNTQIFSTMDLKSGYHQMPLRKEDREMTTFIAPWGQFQWKRGCSFGLSGAPSSFQRMMSVILGDCQFKEALCYLDDIIVWGRDWSEHMSRLCRVLEKLRVAGLVLSTSKCVFGARRIEYLGHVIEEGQVRIREHQVQQLRSLKRPKTILKLRQALGAFCYVQRWLTGMSEMAKPLYEALQLDGRQRLIWTREMTRSLRI